MVDHVDVDGELLYTAALLHDVALADGAGNGLDFTVASAAVALQVADDVGLPSTAAETLASAITLHHSPDVRPSDGPLAYLVSAGAALDVIGLRAWDIPRQAIATVVAQHPRSDFKREFARVYREEAARGPTRSRAVLAAVRRLRPRDPSGPLLRLTVAADHRGTLRERSGSRSAIDHFMPYW